MTQTTIDQRRPNELRPHPMNEEVYGDRADADLIESVRSKGVLNPILITTDNLIVSGHRRWGAAIAADLDTVPVVITPIDDPLAIEEALIESNRQRQKTNEQIGREYKRLKHIYNERQSRQGQRSDLTSSSREDEVKPTAKAAAELGVSQPTAHRIETVVNHIDQLHANGKTDEAEHLRHELNRSANAAYNTVRHTTVDSHLARQINNLSNFLISRGWGINYAPMPGICYVAKNRVRFPFTNREDKAGELEALKSAKAHEDAQSSIPPRPLTDEEAQAVVWRAIKHNCVTRSITPAAIAEDRRLWLLRAPYSAFRDIINPGVTLPDSTLSRAMSTVADELTAAAAPPATQSPVADPELDTIPPHSSHPSQSPRPHVTNNSGNNEWYTPAPIADAARRVLGAIDLDPASCAVANDVIKAEKFYTITDDGLTQPWAGRIWLNPPYASDLVGKFVEKLAAHIADDTVTEAIVLVNNATETAWFQDLAGYATAVCFPKGRIKYWSPDRPDALSPLQGQAIVYIGPHSYKFRSIFSDFGVVL